MSTPELVDAEIVEHKFVGPDFVIVRLPDGTEAKLTVNIVASRIKDQKNPDGTPIFNVNANVSITFKFPTGRAIKVPKPQIPTQAKPIAKDARIIG